MAVHPNDWVHMAALPASEDALRWIIAAHNAFPELLAVIEAAEKVRMSSGIEATRADGLRVLGDLDRSFADLARLVSPQKDET